MNRALAIATAGVTVLFSFAAALSPLVTTNRISEPWSSWLVLVQLVLFLATVGLLLLWNPRLRSAISVTVLAHLRPQHDATSLEHILHDMKVLAAMRLQDTPSLACSKLWLHIWVGPHPVPHLRCGTGLVILCENRVETQAENERLRALDAELGSLMMLAVSEKGTHRLYQAALRGDPPKTDPFSLRGSFIPSDVSGHEMLAVEARYHKCANRRAGDQGFLNR